MQLGESQLTVSENPQIGPLQLTIGYQRAGQGAQVPTGMPKETLEMLLNEVTMSRMHLNEIRFLLMSIDRSLRVPPWHKRLWQWIKSKLRRG